jgi:hypothetical protein
LALFRNNGKPQAAVPGQALLARNVRL